MEFLRSPRSIGLSLGLLIAAGVAGSSAPSSLGPSSGSALANDVSTSTEINCFPEYFSDGECDGDNNNEVCGMDASEMITVFLASQSYHSPPGHLECATVSHVNIFF